MWTLPFESVFVVQWYLGRMGRVVSPGASSVVLREMVRRRPGLGRFGGLKD